MYNFARLADSCITDVFRSHGANGMTMAQTINLARLAAGPVDSHSWTETPEAIVRRAFCDAVANRTVVTRQEWRAGYALFFAAN